MVFTLKKQNNTKVSVRVERVIPRLARCGIGAEELIYGNTPKPALGYYHILV